MQSGCHVTGDCKMYATEKQNHGSDCSLIVVSLEQWDHPYKEGSSLFRFHFSVANILQSPVVVHLFPLG